MDTSKPVAPYIGGKFHLAKTIVARIEAIPHTCYAEPFVGMAGVFLRRRQRAKCEVINDISRDVWGMFRVIQEHYPYFVDYLKFHAASRAEFERLRQVDPSMLTVMVWAIDAGDYSFALDILIHALKQGFSMPDPFKREPAALVLEELADAVLNHHKAGLVVPDDLFAALDQVMEITRDHDLHDTPRAKAFKACGLVLSKDPSQRDRAIACLQDAHRRDPNCGVTTTLNKLLKQVSDV